MDTHETLKAARTIKERGNNCFKRGQLLQAQRDYTEVLAMLTEEITFTGDDQRKEKETLVLTAHLNLAQCALRLGDNARVIYHCNTALGMDSNNIKAHFRKARAFENRAEFAEALEGYRHVLTLEPDNKTVQRQLSECQKKLDSQKAKEQMSNKMAGQEDEEIEDEDVEKVYEDSERVSQTRYKNCRKYPGHKNFINLNDFKIEHLPPDYRDPDLFDHFKNHQSQITVMLQVWPAKKFRSGCGPGTGRNPGRSIRIRPISNGSGFLQWVTLHTKDELTCPCHICKISESSDKKWAEIEIHTAAHVVCNDKQANNTECYFFYDTEEVDLNSCPKLSGAVIYDRDEERDTCTIKFISHDVNFSQQLEEMRCRFEESVCFIRRKYRSSPFGEPEGSLEEYEQLRQRLSELVTERGRVVEQVVAILNGDPRIELAKHREGRKEKMEDDELGNMLWSKIIGGVWYQDVITSLQTQQKEVVRQAREVTELTKVSRQNNNERNVHSRNGFLQTFVNYLEREVMSLKHMLDENAPSPQADFFERAHHLTVIVSHPHGCSKKITIGETTEVTNSSSRLACQLTYTTPTCPGSSGAMVYFLGLHILMHEYPHSAKKSGRQFEYLNESAMALHL